MTIKALITAGAIALDKENRRYFCTEHPERPYFNCEACFRALEATGKFYGTAPDGGFKEPKPEGDRP